MHFIREKWPDFSLQNSPVYQLPNARLNLFWTQIHKFISLLKKQKNPIWLSNQSMLTTDTRLSFNSIAICFIFLIINCRKLNETTCVSNGILLCIHEIQFQIFHTFSNWCGIILINNFSSQQFRIRIQFLFNNFDH